MSKKALFLYMSIGSGHLVAAKAAEHALQTSFSDWETACLDPVSELYPSALRFSNAAYLKCIDIMPGLYGSVWGHNLLGALSEDLLWPWSSKRMAGFLAEHDPDVIVATHAVACAFAAATNRKLGLDTPIVAVETDYAINSYWPSEGIAKYVVATPEMKQDLLAKGIHPAQVSTSGIPIPLSFISSVNRNALQTKMGLEPLPTLLIMAGGLSNGPYEILVDALKWIIVTLDGLPQRFQMVVVTGRNTELRGELQQLARVLGKPTQILGYVNNMHAFMDVSDMIITKPGGTITAQALSKGLPMLLVSRVPGQEAANGQYVVDHGAGVAIERPEEVLDVVRHLLSDPETLARMRQRALGLGKPEAALDVAFLTQQLVTPMVQSLQAQQAASRVTTSPLA
jgi:processive 1,2-diacylglycerol beta-glucosyltransferase